MTVEHKHPKNKKQQQPKQTNKNRNDYYEVIFTGTFILKGIITKLKTPYISTLT